MKQQGPTSPRTPQRPPSLPARSGGPCISRDILAVTLLHTIGRVKDDDLEPAWIELHDANAALGWFVGRPAYEPRRRVPWSMYAFDPKETPKVGRRSREWTATGDDRGSRPAREGAVSAGDSARVACRGEATAHCPLPSRRVRGTRQHVTQARSIPCGRRC
jgi:hypothetical protein